MAKVKVWDRTDGGVSITHFDFSKKLKGETEEDYIERVSSKLRKDPLLNGATEIVVEDSSLPTRDEERDKWIVSNGKVKIDNTIVTKKERNDILKTSLKQKLKLGQPLTDDEVDYLTR